MGGCFEGKGGAVAAMEGGRHEFFDHGEGWMKLIGREVEEDLLAEVEAEAKEDVTMAEEKDETEVEADALEEINAALERQNDSQSVLEL